MRQKCCLIQSLPGGAGAEQHEGRIAVREGSRNTGAAADLPVQLLNDMVRADVSPAFVGKIKVLGHWRAV